ncbi:hypothetical protein [Streptomyces atratus]|uniref:hypothetical protein n=1 Tax=Streptomyces atratus TaxID=1893 RepID=UPI003F540F1B
MMCLETSGGLPRFGRTTGTRCFSSSPSAVQQASTCWMPCARPFHPTNRRAELQIRRGRFIRLQHPAPLGVRREQRALEVAVDEGEGHLVAEVAPRPDIAMPTKKTSNGCEACNAPYSYRIRGGAVTICRNDSGIGREALTPEPSPS